MLVMPHWPQRVEGASGLMGEDALFVMRIEN